MRRDTPILRHLVQQSERSGIPLPHQSIIEIADDRRVLVENHAGVTQYALDQVGIHVKCGELIICGSSLHLEHMSRACLVVSGCIHSLRFERREKR